MDTNPFATNPNIPQQPSQTPAFLQQQPNNPTMAGQASNMVKALMEGNDQFKQGQQLQNLIASKNATLPAPMTTNGMPPVGAPMPLAPPSPGPMAPMPGPSASGAPGGTPMMQNLPFNPSAPQAPAPDMLFHPNAPQPPMQNMGQQPPIDIDPMTQALFSQIPGQQ